MCMKQRRTQSPKRLYIGQNQIQLVLASFERISVVD